MRKATVVIVVALALGPVGCTQEKGGASPYGREGTTSPHAQPSATAKAKDGVKESPGYYRTSKSPSALAGRQFEKRMTVTGVAPGGRNRTFLDVTAEGALVVAENPSPAMEGDQVRIGQSRVGLQSASGFRAFPRPVEKCGDRPRQADQADERGGSVAWNETSSTDLYESDWCVFYYDPTSNKTRLLGNSASVGGELPPPPGQTVPTIGQSDVFWATTHPTRDERKFGVKIVSRPKSGEGEIADAVTKAKLPKADGEALYYVRSEDVAPGFPKNRYEIRKIDETGRDALVTDGQLTTDQQVSVLAVSGPRVTWVVSNPHEERSKLYSLAQPGGKAISFGLSHPGASTMALSVTSKLIAWGSGTSAGDGGEYVFDIARQKLWKVDSQEGFSAVYAKGDFVAWSKAPASQPEGPVSFHTARWK